jgi:hypothetical protein
VTRSRWRHIPPLTFLAVLAALTWRGWSRLDHRPLRVMRTPVGEAREVWRLRGHGSEGMGLISWEPSGRSFVIGIRTDGAAEALFPLRQPRFHVWSSGSSRQVIVSHYLEVFAEAEGLLFHAEHNYGMFSSVTVDRPVVVPWQGGRQRRAPSSEVVAAKGRWLSDVDARRIVVDFLPDGESVELCLHLPGKPAFRFPFRCRKPAWMKDEAWAFHRSVSPTWEAITFYHDGGLWLLRLRKPLPELVKEAEDAERRRAAP